MRLWLSGPRILGIRPGISFRPDELLQRPLPRQARQSQGGFIYVIRSAFGHIKIGISSDPNKRLAQLQTASSVPLAIVYTGALRCEGYAIEAAVHETLGRHRLDGEWFSCPADMAVAAIGAAAHRLGEPIASVPPSHIKDIVQAVALSNQPAPREENLFSRIVMLMLKWIFYLAITLATFILITIIFVIVRAISGQAPQ